MIPLQEFRAEHAEIRDLCSILDHSISDYSLRNNMIICELLERFVDRVNAHLTHEDRSIYRDLLSQHSDDAKKLADHFLGNTQELRRIFNAYSKGWCRKPHNEKKHQQYVDESKQMFKLVCERIEFEEKKIFPYFQNPTS